MTYVTQGNVFGLHSLYTVNPLQGLSRKVLAVPTTQRTDHVTTFYEADYRETGPAEFDQMHQVCHCKVTSPLPIFGEADNWTQWESLDFRDVKRQFDSPVDPQTGTLYLLPDLGGLDTFSVTKNYYQYRVALDARWRSTVVLETCVLIVLLDLWPRSYSASVNAVHGIEMFRDGQRKKIIRNISTVYPGVAAIRLWKNETPQTLFTNRLPLTDDQVKAIDDWTAEFEVRQQAYREAKQLQVSEIRTLLDHRSHQQDELQKELLREKSHIRSLRSDLAIMRSRIKGLKKRRNATKEDILDAKRRRAQAKDLRNVRKDLAKMTRGELRRFIRQSAQENYQADPVHAELAKLYLTKRDIYEQLSKMYAQKDIIRGRQSHHRLAAAAIRLELSLLRARTSVLRSRLESAKALPDLVEGYWDTAPTNFTWTAQPCQAMQQYLEQLRWLEENNRSYGELGQRNIRDGERKLREALLAGPTAIRNRLLQWEREHEPSPMTYGECVMEAMNDVRYIDVNTIAYLKDLPSFASELGALYALLGNINDPVAWASLILNVSYGSRLTIADTEEIIGRLREFMAQKPWERDWSKVQAAKTFTVPHPFEGGSTFRRHVNASVYYSQHEDVVNEYLRQLDNWDVLPSLGNIWDFIPYSFVVDWFVSFGQVMEDIDQVARAASLPLKYYMVSFKDEVTIPKRMVYQLTSSGQTVNAAFYKRSRRDRLDYYLHNLETGLPSWKVMPQATSLLVQNLDRI